MRRRQDLRRPVGSRVFKRVAISVAFAVGVFALFVALLINGSTVDDRGDVIRGFSGAALVAAGFMIYSLRSLRSRSLWFGPPVVLAVASIARIASAI